MSGDSPSAQELHIGDEYTKTITINVERRGHSQLASWITYELILEGRVEIGETLMAAFASSFEMDPILS